MDVPALTRRARTTLAASCPELARNPEKKLPGEKDLLGEKGVYAATFARARRVRYLVRHCWTSMGVL